MLFVDLALARRLELAHAWRGVEYARAHGRLHPDVPVRIEPVARGYAIPGIDGIAPCHWFDPDWNVRVQPTVGAGIFHSPPGVRQF